MNFDAWVESVTTWITWCLHAVAGSAIVAAFAGLVTPVAALMSLLWFLVQLYESRTFQNWLRARRQKKLAKLQQKLLALQQFDDLRERERKAREKAPPA